MTLLVDIADRLYDYTDEERATEAVLIFQNAAGLTDDEVVSLWNNDSDPRKAKLEKAIFDAVDANGTAKRAAESIPNGITIGVE